MKDNQNTDLSYLSGMNVSDAVEYMNEIDRRKILENRKQYRITREFALDTIRSVESVESAGKVFLEMLRQLIGEERFCIESDGEFEQTELTRFEKAIVKKFETEKEIMDDAYLRIYITNWRNGQTNKKTKTE